MKTEIHPEYNAIVFRDLASGETFLTPVSYTHLDVYKRQPVTRSLGAEALEALVELLDTTSRVKDALLAGVERVRSTRDLNVDHRVSCTVELDGLLTRQSAAGEKGLARSQVAEDDGVVFGVDLGLHDVPFEW